MPDEKSHKSKKDNRVGEKTKASNGQMMEIIAYRGWDDIDVKFEDKTIVHNRTYGKFLLGHIKNPNKKTERKGNKSKRFRGSRVGEIGIASNGMSMKIVEYRNSGDVDVEFEDKNKTIVERITYAQFKKGWVKYPASHVDETVTAANGMKMTLIAYHSSRNVDIEFEDKAIVKGKNYSAFKKGEIKHPKKHKKVMDYGKKRLKETNMAHNGMKMKIVKYRNSKDIDVEFVETGEVKRHVAYSSFKKGAISCPNTHTRQLRCREKRIDEIGMTTQGQKMKIIEYRSYGDIDVKFEDETIVRHKTYDNFKKGNIKNPHLPRKEPNHE